MKKLLFSIMAVCGACTFFACSNGDYNVNTDAVANTNINPLNLLDYAGFNWTGTDVISANVNGVNVVIDSIHSNFVLSSDGTNVITGYLGVSHGFAFYLKDVYGGNIYPMGYTITNRYAQWSDSIGAPKTYFSFFGNVGQIQVLRNDPLRLIAKFHFQALDKLGGTVYAINNGWINIHK